MRTNEKIEFAAIQRAENNITARLLVNTQKFESRDVIKLVPSKENTAEATIIDNIHVTVNNELHYSS